VILRDKKGASGMRFSALIGLAFILGVSTAGNAATIAFLPPGNIGPPAGYGSVATFDGVVAEAYGSTAPFGLLLDGGASFTGSGIVMNNGGGASLGLYATPYGDGTNYMAVVGGGTENISYTTLKNSFGLYWGSIDTYNSLTFYNGGTEVLAVTGANLASPQSANGDQFDYASNAYVLLSELPLFDRVVAASTSNSFEFDNVVAGGGVTNFAGSVPETSTWAMMLLGFAGLGYAAYRGRAQPVRLGSISRFAPPPAR
jgi:hypothetical protein